MRYSSIRDLFLVFILITVISAFGEESNIKWKMDAFNEANLYLRESNSKRIKSIIEKQPALRDFFTNVYVPFLGVCEQARRLVFTEKLKRGDNLGDLGGSPYIWALTTPSEPEIELYIDKNATDDLIHEFHKRFAILRASGDQIRMVNDVSEKYATGGRGRADGVRRQLIDFW